MGQQKSKQMTEIVSEITVNTTINNSKNCSQRAINVQNIVIRSTGTVKIDDLVIEQGAFTTLSCITESTQDVGFTADLANDLTNQVLQEMGWLATGSQKSVIENNIHNIITNNNVIEDIQTTFQDVMNQQDILIEAKDDGQIIVGTLYVKQAIEASADSLMTSRAIVDVAAYLENDVANIVEQKQSGFDDIVQAIVDFFKGVWGMAILAFIVVVLAIAWILGSGGGDEQKSEFQSQFQQEFLKMMKGGGST